MGSPACCKAEMSRLIVRGVTSKRALRPAEVCGWPAKVSSWANAYSRSVRFTRPSLENGDYRLSPFGCFLAA